MICEACGGRLGRDCFNTGECVQITASMRDDTHQQLCDLHAIRDSELRTLARVEAACENARALLGYAANEGKSEAVQQANRSAAWRLLNDALGREPADGTGKGPVSTSDQTSSPGMNPEPWSVTREKDIEAACRRMMAVSRPNASPDDLTPAPRGSVGYVKKWETYRHLAEAALRPLFATRQEGERP